MNGLTNHQAREVIATVASECGLTPAIIAGRSRHRPHVQARWEVWRRLVDSGATMTEAGLATGHDQTSVAHSLRVSE